MLHVFSEEPPVPDRYEHGDGFATLEHLADLVLFGVFFFAVVSGASACTSVFL